VNSRQWQTDSTTRGMARVVLFTENTNINRSGYHDTMANHSTGLPRGRFREWLLEQECGEVRTERAPFAGDETKPGGEQGRDPTVCDYSGV